MILRERPSPWQLFFILRGSILQRIKGPLLANIALAVGVSWVHGQFFHTQLSLTPIPFSLIGLALAIFLGFRNTASYERWWEGRKLWGGLIIRARSVTRLIFCHWAEGDRGRAEQVIQVRRVIAFAYELKNALRGEMEKPDSLPYLAPGDQQGVGYDNSRCDGILRRISQDLAQAMAQGRVNPMMGAEIEREITALATIQGACERIRHTPLPFSYSLLLHRTAYLYCLMLPFGLVESVGYGTPLVVGLISYTFFGLDALGDEIEEPFGRAPNDLPLDALCRRIEVDLLAACGEQDLPPLLQPVDYCIQ
jgi:putative membrane protein